MLIGIDVGTTAVKAGLFDLKGHAVKSFTQRYPTFRPASGHVEQDPQDWMTLVNRALGALLEGLPQGAVQAVGLCSQVNTHVFVDDRGRALLPAFTWADGRCGAEALKLNAQLSEAQKLSWWGAPLPVDASHVLSRMAYIRHHHQALWGQTRWVLAPKDYCLLHLTGQVATDPMTAFGVVNQNLSLIPELLGLVEGSDIRLPPITAFTKIIGRIQTGLPGAGLPVVAGAMDAWSGLLGAGVWEDGQGCYLSGTSEILGIVSDTRVPVPGVIAFPRCEGITLHAGPTQSGGASVAWLSRLIGKSAAEISTLAASADPARPLPIFLPHLDGERAPLWDIQAQGSLSGLTSAMGMGEVCRAVLEGVAYSARLVTDSLEISAAVKPDVYHHSGGGAASDVWCQIRADVLGTPIKRMRMLDAGVLGAALMAGTGVGVFPTVQKAAKDFVLTDRLFEPDGHHHDRHNEGFARYTKLYRQLKPWNAS